jgi:hypothetical protein
MQMYFFIMIVREPTFLYLINRSKALFGPIGIYFSGASA